MKHLFSNKMLLLFLIVIGLNNGNYWFSVKIYEFVLVLNSEE